MAALKHAPCGARIGYAAPIAGTPAVLTAYGQLELSGGVRSTYLGVNLATRVGQVVHAAQSGRVKYFATYHGFERAAIVTATGGEQTLYSPLNFKKPPKSRAVKRGGSIGITGATAFHYEVTDGGGIAGGAASHVNPCGNSDGSSGTASIYASQLAQSVTFLNLSLDGVPLPSASPNVSVTAGAAALPALLSAQQITGPHVLAFGNTFAYSATPPTEYYIVLCGNVVFQKGDARSAGPFPFPGTTAAPVPKLIFFRDPGDQRDLTNDLPQPYGKPCPAPPPPQGTFYNVVFGEVGQTWYGYWLGTTGSMKMTPILSTVVTVSPSPSPAPIDTSTPSYPPPVGTYFLLTAAGVGATTVVNANTSASVSVAASPIAVQVLATPSPAPPPTPIPNAGTPTPSPTPVPSSTPSPTPTP